MPATIKRWASQLPVEQTPAVELPMKDLEFLSIMTQAGNMFGGESFVWRTGEGVSGVQESRWHETHSRKWIRSLHLPREGRLISCQRRPCPRATQIKM